MLLVPESNTFNNVIVYGSVLLFNLFKSVSGRR